MSRFLPLLFALLVACDVTRAARTPLQVYVAPAHGPAWVEGCGARVPLVDGRAQLEVAGRCRVQAARDDGGVVVRSPAVPVDKGDTALALQLPPPGRIGTAGFTLAPHAGGAVVVPLHHTPIDPRAPHPAWLEGLVVRRAAGRSVRGLTQPALDARVAGPPGTSFVLEFEVPTDSPWTCPLCQEPGARYVARFTRQEPLAARGRVRGLVDDWVERSSFDADTIASAMARWRVR